MAPYSGNLHTMRDHEFGARLLTSDLVPAQTYFPSFYCSHTSYQQICRDWKQLPKDWRLCSWSFSKFLCNTFSFFLLPYSSNSIEIGNRISKIFLMNTSKYYAAGLFLGPSAAYFLDFLLPLPQALKTKRNKNYFPKILKFIFRIFSGPQRDYGATWWRIMR